jgi:hypothetical protein
MQKAAPLISGRDCLIRILFLIPFIVLGCGSEISHPVSRTELSIDVKQMLSPGFDPDSVSLNGVGLGDSQTAIPKNMISETHENIGWIHLNDGCGYKIQNGTVITLKISGSIVESLLIASEEDLIKLFGEPDEIKRYQAETVNNTGFVLFAEYYYHKRGLEFSWVDRLGGLAFIRIVKPQTLSLQKIWDLGRKEMMDITQVIPPNFVTGLLMGFLIALPITFIPWIRRRNRFLRLNDNYNLGSFFPVRYCTQKRYKSWLKLFPWEGVGFVGSNKNTIEFRGFPNKGEPFTLTFAVDSISDFAKPNWFRNGMLSWLMLQNEKEQLYFSAETGPFIFGSQFQNSVILSHLRNRNLQDVVEQSGSSPVS